MITAKNVYEFCRTWVVWSGLLTAVLAASGYIAYNKMERGRRLSTSKTALLAETLKFVTKPSFPVEMMRPVGDDEALDVADEIKQALEDAGFKIDPIRVDRPIGDDPIGILIRRNAADAMTGEALANAFKKVDLASKIIDYGDEGHLQIIIGRKPPY